jgi:hypothetical protein
VSGLQIVTADQIGLVAVICLSSSCTLAQHHGACLVGLFVKAYSYNTTE